MRVPLLPPATLGIIGGGQLGMMIVREAQRMGYRTVIWDPDPECPASRLADETVTAAFNDSAAADRLAAAADAVTYEFENVDVQMVRRIEESKPVHPGSAALAVAHNRLAEKTDLTDHAFPVVRYAFAPAGSSLREAVRKIGLPVVVKTAAAGYDGKGQTILRTPEDLWTHIGTDDRLTSDHIVEEFLPLESEISVLAARSEDGTVRTFPPSENEHRDNILHASRVPAQLSGAIQSPAADLARRIVSAFNMTGLLCVEMFVTQDWRLLVNELAPRPHNSGHYTLDACDCSQFEMLIRVLCGLPMPEPRLLTPCTMINLLGKHLDRVRLEELLAIPGARLHLYGKTRREPLRKMGHVTVLGSSVGEVAARVRTVKQLIGE